MISVMRSALSVICCGLLALVLSSNSASAQLPPSGFEVGQPFPVLEMTDLESGTLRSTDNLFAGKKTVLHIFASW